VVTPAGEVYLRVVASQREEASQLAVSVIVPVRDGGIDLPELIASLRAQTLPRRDFEVLIADDGSSDGATARLPHENGWLSVLAGPRRNPYAARNRAAARARGRVLAFCDVDCRPEPDWLERGLAGLERAEVVAGLVRFVRPSRLTAWSLVDMDTFLDQERTVRTGGAVTANLFVGRTLFERVGGFDGTLANGGDQEFVRRCVADGARLAFERDAVVAHPTRDRARELLGKVWLVNRRHAAREARAGRRPGRLALRSLVPLVQQLRSRARTGRSIGLDRSRLGESGVEPSLWDQARALPIIYLLMPYLATAAQARGWVDGRRMRQAEHDAA
jgi:glycosyltransferase involved in cell wall biosynthesis